MRQQNPENAMSGHQKPYLKKDCTLGKFSVWFVDGAFVRRNLDEEFTNFGQHFRFPFIPMWEFWIDKELVPGEDLFYIDHLLVEHALMKSGMSYLQALDAANVLESKERAKTKLAKLLTKEKHTQSPHLLTHIHQRPWNTYRVPNLTIWIVNGEAIRDTFFIDFTSGGHGYVYNFVPIDEVWIDNDVQLKERRFVLLHELHERSLMKKGWSYPKAHANASRIEFYCRHFPATIKKYLSNELSQS